MKHYIVFALRIIGAIVLPILSFHVCEEFFYHLIPWTLWTYKGEGIIGMITSGFFAGNCFSAFSYEIIPRWKIKFTMIASSICSLVIIAGIIFLIKAGSFNWLHIVHHIMAVLGMMITAFVLSCNDKDQKSHSE